MNRILLATDFSPHADAALPHARRFAAAFGAELHVLNVVVPYGPSSPLLEEYPGEGNARSAMESLSAEGVSVHRAVIRGIAAAPSILQYADDQDVDLIVMGSHGRRGVRRMLLGSVTEEVLRAGRWPVLTVHTDRHGEPRPAEYGRILAPVDFSKHTPVQLDMVRTLADRFSSAIDLVHVVDPPVVPELYMPIAPLVIDVEEATRTAIDKLAELAASLGDGHDVRTDVLVGGAVHEIEKWARDHADLIVMPTHGYSGLDRILMGSIAEGVIRRSECPVLVLKVASDDADD